MNLRAYIAMARPLLLLAVLPIYWIGGLIARAFGQGWDLVRFWWGLAVLVPVTLASHYANEYADFETDALTVRTPFSGGSGVLAEQAGLRRGALWAAALLVISGLLAAWAGLRTGALSPWSLALWAAGTVFSLAYSLPPFKLAWRGWSEVINAVIIALLLPLYGYTVQAGYPAWTVVVGCLPFALLIFSLILATNWADRDADRQVGKMTLSARLRRPLLRRLYAAAAFLGIALQPLLIGVALPPLVAWSSLPAAPVIYWAWTRYTKTHSPLPTVIAMLTLLPLQLWAWIAVGT